MWAMSHDHTSLQICTIYYDLGDHLRTFLCPFYVRSQYYVVKTAFLVEKPFLDYYLLKYYG